LITSLWLPYRRVRRDVDFTSLETPLHKLGPRRFFVALYWQLDVIGLVLLIIIFSGILAPLTIAGRNPEQWKEAKILVPLIVGILCIPAWLVWEKSYARSTLLPFRVLYSPTCVTSILTIQLLTDRAVWGALGIAWLLQFCWTLQGNFLYTILKVSFNESITSATRIVSLYR
jgi:SIT family siderophore-iron:H+ symporter-like MFS transporter